MSEKNVKKEKKLVVYSVNLANAVMEYLSNRPYKEVERLINGMQHDGALITEGEWNYASNEIENLRKGGGDMDILVSTDSK